MTIQPAEDSNLRILTQLLDRAILSAKLGQQFGGSRDTYSVLGYKKTLTFNDFYQRYRRQNVARRIVTAPPAATWRHTPIVKEDENPDQDTQFEAAWKSLERRLRVTAALEQVDRLAGIGRYGVLLIGVRGEGDLAVPLRRGSLSNPEQVIFLRAYTEASADIKTFITDPQDERFGQVGTYEITTGNQSETTGISSFTTRRRVHWTRVIHVAEETEENDVYGTPRLEPVDTLFDDLAKLVGGSAEMFWQGAERGLHLDARDGFSLKDDQATADLLTDEVEEYIHGLSRFIRTEGVDINRLEGKVADPSGPLEGVLNLIAGATGIPKRILLGSERGELASSQDEGNWVARIEERQRKFAEPRILRAFIDRLVFLGALPEPSPDGFMVEWPNLFPKSEEDRANIAMRVATAIQRYAQASGQPVDGIMTVEEFRERVLGLPADPPT